MKILTFKYRIFLGIAFAVIIYAICSIVFIEQYMTKAIHKENIGDGQALSALVAENIRQSLEKSNLPETQEYLKFIMKTNPEIAYIFIQKDNKVLIHTFKDSVPDKLIGVKHIQEGINYKNVLMDKDIYYDFSTTLQHPSSGTLRVGISDKLGHEVIENIIHALIYFTFLFLALALVSSVLAARRLTSPLTMLSAAASDITDKNLYRPVPIDSNDEIGQLSTAFNKMIQVVKEREDDLILINDELETVNITLHEYIGQLKITTDELIKAKQDTAVIDTARSFMHHLRQPLTYLIMAIELLTDEILAGKEINTTTICEKLGTIEDAGKKLSELLKKFDNLKEYKVVVFDGSTKITDIEA
jgi:methyl-accepting chemotaxis protein